MRTAAIIALIVSATINAIAIGLGHCTAWNIVALAACSLMLGVLVTLNAIGGRS